MAVLTTWGKEELVLGQDLAQGHVQDQIPVGGEVTASIGTDVDAGQGQGQDLMKGDLWITETGQADTETNPEWAGMTETVFLPLGGSLGKAGICHGPMVTEGQGHVVEPPDPGVDPGRVQEPGVLDLLLPRGPGPGQSQRHHRLSLSAKRGQYACISEVFSHWYCKYMYTHQKYTHLEVYKTSWRCCIFHGLMVALLCARSMSTSPKPPAVIKRYRRDSLSSHSSQSEDDDDDKSLKETSSKKDNYSASRVKWVTPSRLLQCILYGRDLSASIDVELNLLAFTQSRLALPTLHPLPLSFHPPLSSSLSPSHPPSLFLSPSLPSPSLSLSLSLSLPPSLPPSPPLSLSLSLPLPPPPPIPMLKSLLSPLMFFKV